MKTKSDVLQQLQSRSHDICALGVRRLGLFGSYVRGDHGRGSDVDILVEFDPERKTFDNFMSLCFLLDDILQDHVEVVTRESLSPYIGPHVLNEVEYVDFAA